ncbi:hypothetical protein Dsin_030068 [Dipteronia sinensis]|uniref:Uncharacterized protein n=1 Tax=Dipteronia sinensis TaxID=43782 RepID=A0AAD9ZIR0_9ROSI|nr:hypothetical protein Dsin_030068 [Dipteronia sinensis]
MEQFDSGHHDGRNIGAKKLVIYHGGNWVANCYEGGMIKWVHVPIGLTYDGLVKLVQDIAKVDADRYTLELCSLAFTNSGTARPRIENNKDVSCMMDEDKLLSEVYVTVSKKVATHCVQNSTILEEDDNLVQSTFLQQCNLPTPQPVYVGFLRQLVACWFIPILDPIVCNDETIDDEENSQSSDTDNRDDSSIPDIDRGSHEDEDCNHSVGSGSGSVEGHGCGGHRVLLHLAVFPLEIMDWVTVLIKVVNMLP